MIYKFDAQMKYAVSIRDTICIYNTYNKSYISTKDIDEEILKKKVYSDTVKRLPITFQNFRTVFSYDMIHCVFGNLEVIKDIWFNDKEMSIEKCYKEFIEWCDFKSNSELLTYHCSLKESNPGLKRIYIQRNLDYILKDPTNYNIVSDFADINKVKEILNEEEMNNFRLVNLIDVDSMSESIATVAYRCIRMGLKIKEIKDWEQVELSDSVLKFSKMTNLVTFTNIRIAYTIIDKSKDEDIILIKCMIYKLLQAVKLDNTFYNFEKIGGLLNEIFKETLSDTFFDYINEYKMQLSKNTEVESYKKYLEEDIFNYNNSKKLKRTFMELKLNGGVI